MTSFNNEAMKLGLTGVTIIAAAGDDGVANYYSRQSASYCGYYPSFPASSPYVTAVGATQGPEINSIEIACSTSTGASITTGGGFSNLFNALSFQSSAIANYFASLTSSQQPISGFNSARRGYPDVSMAGSDYLIIIGGAQYSVSIGIVISRW